jgi:serine/threonine-protein kinase
MSTPCPDPQRLRQLLDSTLPEAEQVPLQAHLETCVPCQRALEGLVAGTESWDNLARHLGRPGTEPTQPALRQAIERLEVGPAAEATTANGPAGTADLSFLGPSERPGGLGRLGHYEVLEVVGRGGFGVVLRAFDEQLHRVVAIKALAPALAANATARRRFIREAQAAAAVRDEHVVAIYGVDGAGPVPYLVMEYIRGISLQERLDRSGPLEVKEVLRIGRQVACGLAAAHAQGLVHRDIKPANILLENGVQRVKLTDFGLARAVDDASLTQSGVVTGTPLYMAPEQARGERVDHRADLFSLGSVLYTACTGRPPFRATGTMAVLKRVIEDTARPPTEINPEVPGWLEAIIARLHAKDPAQRFASAREVADLLGQHLAHLQQPSQVPLPPSALRPIPRRRLRERKRLLLGGALLTLGLLLAGWWAGPTAYRFVRGQGRVTVTADDPGAWVILSHEGQVFAGLDPQSPSVELPAGSFFLEAFARGGRHVKAVILEHRRLFAGSATYTVPPTLLHLQRGASVTVRVQTIDQPVRSIPGWGNVIDPTGDCDIMTKDGRVTITVPTTTTGILSAQRVPHILQKVEGDFRVQVKVLPFPQLAGFQTNGHAGLLVCQDDKDFLRAGKNFLQLANFAGGDSLLVLPEVSWIGGMVDQPGQNMAHLPPNLPTYLRVERRQGKLKFSYNTDGRGWFDLTGLRVPNLPAKLQVGVVAVNDALRTFTAQFEEFRLSKLDAGE